MFGALVWKEIKYQLRNMTLYLFMAVVLLFYMTQFLPEVDSGMLQEPQPGLAMYGSKDVTDQETEMKVVFQDLNQYYDSGFIYKQALIINKTVYLSEKQKQIMKEAMARLGSYSDSQGKDFLDNIHIKVSYEEYLDIIRQLDKDLGGSTYYGDTYRSLILRQPMTYEDALKEYEDIKTKDKITNAYGRIFADYMGITAGLFPVFVAAFVLTRDKRSRMQELIYGRTISSIKYATSKYVALLACMIPIYLALAAHATYRVLWIANQEGFTADPLGIFRYTLLWIIPTLMFTTAIGMLVSALSGSGVAAVLLQFVLWFVSISSLKGRYELYRSVIRFNTIGDYNSYIKWLPQITANRVFYTLLSLALLLAASWILSRRREAVNGFKILKHH